MRCLPTILFIFLSLAIATSEIPELCNLVDDPSNNAEPSALEYHAALTREQTIFEAAEPLRTAIGPITANSTFRRRKAVTDGPLFSAWTGQGVLLFICSFRT
jgi:hypothetical protein